MFDGWKRFLISDQYLLTDIKSKHIHTFVHTFLPQSTGKSRFVLVRWQGMFSVLFRLHSQLTSLPSGEDIKVVHTRVAVVNDENGTEILTD